jgi:phosphatidylglycerophosphate synthase
LRKYWQNEIMPEPREELFSEDTIADVVGDDAHNSADDLFITRIYSHLCEEAVRPLVEHVFVPLQRYNRNAALLALNATLTAPRLLEPKVGAHFVDNVKNGRGNVALALAGLKFALKGTDGFDGAAARQSHLTSVGGGLFDGFVDMVGTFDDARRIIELAEAEGDVLTANLMKLRRLADGFIVITAVGVNGSATYIAKSRGVVIDERDKPKSNALGKLKFGVGVLGNMALLCSYAVDDRSLRNRLKRSGQALNVAAIGIAVPSGIKYLKDGLNKLARKPAGQLSVDQNQQQQI